MFKLLVILFIIEIYARNTISKIVVGTYLKDRKDYILQVFLYDKNNTGISTEGFSFDKAANF